MLNDQIAELKKWASNLAGRDSDGEEVQWARAAEIISKSFGVKPHEVAILTLTRDERFLRFLAPDNLRAVGQIPLSSAHALASRTVRDMRPELINHFQNVRHATVFEGVPIAQDERGDPIQKIMSSPVMAGDRAIGVVQVSRKGKTPSDAGPDFTHPELRTLKIISDTLAPCLAISAIE